MNVAVVGAGSWGTALAAHLARSTHAVRLWARDAALAREIEGRHENSRYLPGITLPALRATSDLAEALKDAEIAFVAVPSEFCRETFRALRPHLGAGTTLVSATKGLELGTLRRMSEVAAEEAPGHPVAVLSGPSFALEVAQGQPTTVVVASDRPGVAEAVQRAVSSRSFRAYSSDDVIGVELGGSLKNVIAIAAGIVDGLGYGHNTVAALITRGLAEMTPARGRAGRAAGHALRPGRPRRPRAHVHGSALPQPAPGPGPGRGSLGGRSPGRAAHGRGGRPHHAAACALAERAAVEMPIAEQMRAVLYEGKPPREAVDELMLRSLKRE